MPAKNEKLAIPNPGLEKVVQFCLTFPSGFPGHAPYVASKHAVLGLTKTAALEYAKQGIRINAICPGGIETPLLDSFTGGDSETLKYIESLHPIGRLGKPNEIADAVVWLCSDEASFVLGQGIAVDGGFTTI